MGAPYSFALLPFPPTFLQLSIVTSSPPPNPTPDVCKIVLCVGNCNCWIRDDDSKDELGGLLRFFEAKRSS